MKRTVLVLVLVASWSPACRGPVNSDLPSNSPRSVRQEARACDNGDAMACTNVAATWLDGSLGTRDENRARALLEGACTAGAGLGCVALADLVGADRAISLLSGACPSEPIACLHLGYRLSERDPAAAYVAFSQACEARILAGCLEQAARMREGVGIAPDPERGSRLMQTTCSSGSMPACRELSKIRAQTDDDPYIARTLALGACQGGDAEACAMAAEYMAASDDPEDRASAIIFRRRACELGYELACAETEPAREPEDGAPEPSSGSGGASGEGSG